MLNSVSPLLISLNILLLLKNIILPPQAIQHTNCTVEGNVVYVLNRKSILMYLFEKSAGMTKALLCLGKK